MDNYADWAAKQVARRRRPALYLAGAVVAVLAVMWLYDYAPFVGKYSQRESAMDSAEKQLVAPLDRQLDAYLNRLAPVLQRAGFATAQFVDASKPAFRDSNPDGGVKGVFTPNRQRELISEKGKSRTVIGVGVTTGPVKAESIMQSKLAGLNAKTYFNVRVSGTPDCLWLTNLAFAAISRPIEAKAARQYDDFMRSKGSSDVRTSLSKACESKGEFSASGSSGIGTNMSAGPTASRAAWGITVFNLNDVSF